MPVEGELSHQNIKDRYYGVNDPVAAKLRRRAGEMPSLAAPDDMSIKTLYVGGLVDRVTEEDLKDQFYSYGELESIRMVPQRACAFVTYTTREGAERAADQLANKLVINGLRLKLMWGRPQVAKAELDEKDEDGKANGTSLMLLPRALVPHQQGPEQQGPNYFNLPPPGLSSERPFYPSMDPQRMGHSLLLGHSPCKQQSVVKLGGEAQDAQQGPPPPPPYQFGYGPPHHFQHFRGHSPFPPPPHSFQPFPPHFQGGPPPQFFHTQF